jgi:hypothetical protein
MSPVVTASHADWKKMLKKLCHCDLAINESKRKTDFFGGS